MVEDLISVIVPIYNAEKYIEKCVCSILKQKYTNFELILVDDGSTDNSLSICNKMKETDERIVVLKKNNGGAGSARNAGLDYACGKYYVFIDSDDYVSDTYLLNLYYSISEGDFDIVQCKTKATKKSLFTAPTIEFVRKDVSEITKEEALNGYRYKVAVWGKIYKSSVFKNFRFNENIIYEDDDSYYQLAYFAKRIAILNETLYYYYLSNNSVMRNNKQNKSIDFLDIYERRKKYFRDKEEDALYIGTIKRYCLVLCLSYCYFKKNKNNQDDLEKIFQLFRSNYHEIKKMNTMSVKEKVLFDIFDLFPNITSFFLSFIK